MNAHSSASPSQLDPRDVRLVRRLVLFCLIALAITAFFSYTWHFFSRKFYAPTGAASWIWVDHRLSSGEPVAFFLAKTFRLPRQRTFVKIKIAADPEYTLFFNGHAVGGGRIDRHHSIDVYDVTPLAVEGNNRLVVATRSGNGVGGFIASLDCSDMAKNVVESDRSWRAYTGWNEQLLRRDLPLPKSEIRLLGRPPFGRWNYLPKKTRELWPRRMQRHTAIGASSFVARIPRIEVKSGVAVVTVRNEPAIAYDFGHVRARMRLARNSSEGASVKVRFANAPDEFQHEAPTESIVFAPGERVVTDPEEREFRYVLVYGSNAQPEILTAVTE